MRVSRRVWGPCLIQFNGLALTHISTFSLLTYNTHTRAQESKVGSLLSRGGEVDVLDSGGATPLMLACHQGNPQLGACC